MRKFILASLTFFVFLSVKGQNTRLEISQLGVFSSNDLGQSKVYINQESQLNEIVVAKTQTQKESEVWSVQIYQGSGKNARGIASATINGFKSKYGDIEARLLYPSPYFKVTVGNFKTRIEAESFRRKILNEYPNSRVESAVNSKDN